MAYRNVSTPRFYVNVLEWGALNGVLEIDNLFITLPVIPKLINETLTVAISGAFPQISGTYNDNTTDGTGCAIFVLGHNTGTQDTVAGVYGHGSYSGEGYFDVNWFNGLAYDGWSMTTLTHDPASNLMFNFQDANGIKGTNAGSIVMSSYYTIPRSPDLSLNLNWEYGGSYHETTHLGGSISNTMWSEPPMWGDQAPWELTDPSDQNYTVPIYHYKSGRRVWELKFSYLDGEDLWGSNQNLSDILINEGELSSGDITTGDIDEDTFTYNILTDDNFFSQVWNKTLGGTIPFIFQPDSNNFNPDQFAICRIKENSLTADQVAPGVYDISLTIEEAW